MTDVRRKLVDINPWKPNRSPLGERQDLVSLAIGRPEKAVLLYAFSYPLALLLASSSWLGCRRGCGCRSSRCSSGRGVTALGRFFLGFLLQNDFLDASFRKTKRAAGIGPLPILDHLGDPLSTGQYTAGTGHPALALQAFVD